jgi:hypothetical protein|tara:strand:+ start:1524 stop:2306 length:783 start_codon:yes stop_codon:yes gene_type:complete
MKIKKLSFKTLKKYYKTGKKLLNDPIYLEGQKKSKIEFEKKVKRSEIINFILNKINRETNYLEIGVRNPEDNYSKIKSTNKYSVDPGIEFDKNPVDFKMTSDDFFSYLDQDKVLSKDIRFDVVFIDGLHLAEQVDRDIINSLRYLKEDGFIVLHDCNPPTEWHSRENYYYRMTPAVSEWNGTTWKAFLKWRYDSSVESCCIDTDWGVGVISKKYPIGRKLHSHNLFFEFKTLDNNREEQLNLMSFDSFKKIISETIHNNP